MDRNVRIMNYIASKKKITYLEADEIYSSTCYYKRINKKYDDSVRELTEKQDSIDKLKKKYDDMWKRVISAKIEKEGDTINFINKKNKLGMNIIKNRLKINLDNSTEIYNDLLKSSEKIKSEIFSEENDVLRKQALLPRLEDKDYTYELVWDLDGIKKPTEAQLTIISNDALLLNEKYTKISLLKNFYSLDKNWEITLNNSITKTKDFFILHLPVTTFNYIDNNGNYQTIIFDNIEKSIQLMEKITNIGLNIYKEYKSLISQINNLKTIEEVKKIDFITSLKSINRHVES